MEIQSCVSGKDAAGAACEATCPRSKFIASFCAWLKDTIRFVMVLSGKGREEEAVGQSEVSVPSRPARRVEPNQIE